MKLPAVASLDSFKNAETLKKISKSTGLPSLRYFGFLLILIYFLVPMYIFESGGFQIVDIIIVVLIISIIFSKINIDQNIRRNIFNLIPFIIWVNLINGGYFLYYSKDTWFLKSSIAVSYGFVTLYVFAIVFYNIIKNKKISYIYYGILFSIAGCFAVRGHYEFSGYTEFARTTLSFNNANQLAYFAVLLMGYAILLVNSDVLSFKKNKIFFLIEIVFILVAHFFALISISRSGIFAFLILDLGYLLNLKNTRTIAITISTAIVAMILILLIKPTFVQERMAVRGEQQWSKKELIYGKGGIIARALEPIKHLNGIQLLIGRGTGLQRDWEQYYKSHGNKEIPLEVHNMFGDILRCYGFIGLMLFFFWYFRVVWDARNFKSGLWIMAGLFLYNFGNNGIRFRSFWIFMAFFTVFIFLIKEKKPLDV